MHIGGLESTGEERDLSLEDYFRVEYYYPAIDTLVHGLEGRFQQEVYKIYSTMEHFLLEVANARTGIYPEIPSEMDKYPEVVIQSGELDAFNMVMRKHEMGCKTLSDIITGLKMQDRSLEDLFPGIIAAIRLLLLLPATSAEAERAFSLLRRTKTWLRSTMTTNRLNSLSLLSHHKELTDNIDLEDVGEKFISKCNRRARFGQFK